MTLFSNSRTRRRTVFTVLVVWLFALSSGWANACLLQDRGTHVNGPLDSASLDWPPIVSAGHFGAESAHDANSDAAKGVCLKVCDEGTQIIVKLISSVDLADVAMAPPVSFAWTAQSTAARLGGSWALPAPDPGVPLRTRLSRLAL